MKNGDTKTVLLTEQELKFLLKMLMESPIQGTYKSLTEALQALTEIKNKLENALK